MDDVSRLQERDKELPSPDAHRLGVHRAGQQQRCMHAVERQRGDQREVLPAPARNVVNEPLAARSPTVCPREREVDPTLVHEPKASLAPALPTLAEYLPGADYVRPLALRGLEGLFFRVRPSRRRLRHIVVSLTATAVCFASNSDSSTREASGRFAASFRSRRSVAPFTKRSLPGAFPGAGSPVSRTWIRSFRTKLALTANLRPTRNSEAKRSLTSRLSPGPNATSPNSDPHVSSSTWYGGCHLNMPTNRLHAGHRGASPTLCGSVGRKSVVAAPTGPGFCSR